MAAADLYGLCREFLIACEEAVALAPGGPIDRSFVSPGPPAWDCCPQLTVHAGGPVVSDTAPLRPPLQIAHRIQGHVELNLVTLTATVIRCVPGLPENSLDAPDADALDASSETTLGDVWSIWNHIATRKRDLSLWGPKEREVVLDPAVALNAAGNCAGWQVQVRVQLDGYRTV
jgi:hypothetical protein